MLEGVAYKGFETPETSTLAAHLASLDAGVAIVQGPFRSGFARVDADGALRDETGMEIALDTLFEIRAFDGQQELRWLREGAGGRGVILHETGETPGALGAAFLIWGEWEQAGADGWTAMSSARIGRLWVPYPAESRAAIPHGLRVTAREYVVVGRDGNAAVVDTRLIEIAPTPAPTKSGD